MRKLTWPAMTLATWLALYPRWTLRAVLFSVPMAFLLAACARAPLPVDRPCGAITDSLAGVEAVTRDGERRLAIHHARGRAAGCW